MTSCTRNIRSVLLEAEKDFSVCWKQLKKKGEKNTHTHTVYRIEREKETVLRVASWPISACYSDVTMATVPFFPYTESV